MQTRARSRVAWDVIDFRSGASVAGDMPSTLPCRLPTLRFSRRRAWATLYRLAGVLVNKSIEDPAPCFIGSCKAQGGLLRMASFSKEHDRNVFSCPFYCVKWGPQNLVITAPARIGFTAFNRVCSIGHPVIYDTARVITKGSNQTKSDQSGPTPFLCGRKVGFTENTAVRHRRGG